MEIAELYQLYLQHPSVQTDTRKLKTGDLFFALKGDNFNGNAFAQKALDAGAAFAVIDDPAYQIEGKTILVSDVLTTLQQLAKYHRQQFSNGPTGKPFPVLAITGSNGKTTTKELIHAVLQSAFRTYTTEGNLNNHIGIPLTLLKIKKDAEIAVVEMGANHQQEIASYCTYALPTHGLISNCGKAHLEGFGGVEGVKKGKGELYDHLRQYNGTAFVMWDYDYLREMSKGISNIITYGTAAADIEGHALKTATFLEVAVTKGAATGNIKTQLVGDYNLPNVLAAIAVGKYFGVPDEKIKKALEEYTPSNSRSQLIQKGSNSIILDAYNANPSSMKLAIENFAAINAEKKILLLGAMAELGAESLAEHQSIVDLLKKYNWTQVVLVGGDFLQLTHPFVSLPNALAAKEWLKAANPENSQLLIKGSRSMKMETVLED
ncbi:MAG: UDP-N-acetylmuramoyl-tripeptide--D-alanyl-D-alanine ligase [Chitinophagaceae bacterium]|nr:UDP-N-acetylmuramoyl-tripeptide--D-alanyl-D-alanine ligase [Chitinophagaceae bacterium]MBP8244577.1 UDP-N-acetylmuramoyl-tripeptide--D-alanyl-D-alanine ligase [Chitinophagaceae bacterium]